MNSLAQVLWRSPDYVPVAIALAAVLASTALWLYPPQTRGIRWIWRWTMPALRGMAAAALVVALVRPMVLRPRTATREGPIVLLADRSGSMAVVDGADRSPAELVALAAGLGQLPGKSGGGSVRVEVVPLLRVQLDAIEGAIEQVVRAQSEAEYARLSERDDAARSQQLRTAVEVLRSRLAELSDQQPTTLLQQRIAALKAARPQLNEEALRALRGELEAAAKALAASQAQADAALYRDNAEVRAACARLAELSRAQLLETALNGAGAPGEGVLAKLPAGVAVQGFAFADEVEAISDGIRRDANGLNLAASGSQSDVAEALRAALRLTTAGIRAATPPPQAIVLMSDGRQVGGESEGLMSDLSSTGVPVYPVAMAAAGSPRRDLSIIRLETSPAARVGQTILVRAELRGVGLRGQGIDVRLDAGAVRQVRRVTFATADSPGASTVVAEFEVYLPRPGPQRLSANVLPLEGEASAENNSADTWVKVGADPARVMVIAGETAGRQYASLHAALSRPQWIALREIDDEGQYESLSPKSILEQEMIVLIDLPADRLNDAQWTALTRAARERGASVVLCAGQALPEGYGAHPIASAFLPYDPAAVKPTWRTWPGGEAQFRVAPAGEWETGEEWIGGVERAFWRNLPALSRMMPLTRLRREARAVLVERDGGAAVMTATPMGLGRVFFIATDQSWRWRGRTGVGPGGEREQFWPQLVRLAAGEPYAAAAHDLRLDVDNLFPEPNEPVQVRARVYDWFGSPVSMPKQSLQVLRYGSQVREVALAPRGQATGQYEGLIDGLPAGDYVLQLEAPQDPAQEYGLEPVRLALRVAPRMGAELANLSGDEQFLRRIADASGGEFLTLDRLGELPQALEENRQKLNPLVEYPLWDSPYLFVFVLSCLSAEWALRKKFGLA